MNAARPDYDNLELEELNYGSYLRIPELLSLQKEISAPAHHDEMFFIIIHQAAELWFRLMIHETETLVESFRSVSVSRALKTLRRQVATLGLLEQQIKMLRTLTPAEFAGFRDLLKPASGFQSIQFRKVEFIYGIRDRFFLKFFKKQPEVAEELEQILNTPSVYDEFLRSLHGAGYPVPRHCFERDFAAPRESGPELVEVLRKLYEDPGDDYHWVLLFESMIDLDVAYLHWKNAHVTVVGRTIGHKTGTGGSAEYDFLRSRLELRFFPELWEVRNRIGEHAGRAD
jgi:tryptophan 2,3-dioxygenase